MSDSPGLEEFAVRLMDFFLAQQASELFQGKICENNQIICCLDLIFKLN